MKQAWHPHPCSKRSLSGSRPMLPGFSAKPIQLPLAIMCLTVHGLLAEADAHPQLHPMSHSCLRLKSTSAARCCRQANVHSFRRLYVAFAFSGTPATSFVPCAVACLLSSSFFQPQYCPPATRVTPCCIVLFCGCWLDLGSPCLVLLFNLYHYSPALICLQVGSQSWRGAL